MIIFENMSMSQTYSCVAEAKAVLKDDDIKRYDKCGNAILGLLDIYLTHAQPNWDGRGAMPVSTISLKNALIFVLSVPDEFPCPSPGVGADGKITLEWRLKNGHLFSLAFDDKDLINYIAFLPDDEILWGTRPSLLGYNKTFLELLKKIY